MEKSDILSLKRSQLKRIKELMKDPPTWEHSFQVAKKIAQISKNEDLIIASLLHDSIEDNYLNYEEIKEIFNKEVAFLVQSVTDIKSVDANNLPKNKRDDFYQTKLKSARKMLLQSGKDLRVILLKMAECLHNLTRKKIPLWRRKQIARFSLLVLAPIAQRLLLSNFKNELTDKAFKLLQPVKYKEVKTNIKQRIEELEIPPTEIIGQINRALAKESIEANLQYRIKSVYSTYKKLKENNQEINTLHDLVGIRLIVKNKDACYQALSIINRLWQPKKIKDYINNPKPNGYQSIHVIIKLESSQLFEVQIRTKKMNEKADKGVWAHWQYKEKGGNNAKEELEWVKSLTDKLERLDQIDSLEGLRINLFKDKIFVYSPQDEVIELPQDSTPIDYAYRIHSDLGNNLKGAKVNGKLVKLNYQLKNGQTVEVLTDNKKQGQAPTRDWLKYVVTQKAKEHIRKQVR